MNNLSEREIQINRVNFLKWLISDKFRDNKSEFARATGVGITQIQRVLTDENNTSYRPFTDKLAKKIELTLGLARGQMDIGHQLMEKNNPPDEPSFTVDNQNRYVKKPFVLWSNYCININSIKEKTELTGMLLEKEIIVAEDSFIIEIDSDNYERLYKGTQLLIDLNCSPKNRDLVIISFDKNPPTIAKWLSELGELQVELLEQGYPGSTHLEGKEYKILGVVIWVQKKGSRTI